MEVVKEVLTSKQAKRFYWQTLAGFLGILVILFTEINWVYAPFVIALLSGISKEIHNKYNK